MQVIKMRILMHTAQVENDVVGNLRAAPRQRPAATSFRSFFLFLSMKIDKYETF